jgi:predicted NodU family carbamoyl transferase
MLEKGDIVYFTSERIKRAQIDKNNPNRADQYILKNAYKKCIVDRVSYWDNKRHIRLVGYRRVYNENSLTKIKPPSPSQYMLNKELFVL